MKLLFIIFGILFFSQNVVAQSKTDSLRLLLNNEVSERRKIALTLELGKAFYPDNNDSSLYYLSPLLDNPSISTDTLALIEQAIGIAYYVSGNYDNSAKHNLKAMQLFKKEKNLSGIAEIYNTMGLTFSTLKRHQKSAEYHWKSIEIATQLGDSRLIGRNCINLAINYKVLPTQDSTLYYANKAIEIFTAIKNDFQLAMSYNHKADAYYNSANYEEAIRWNSYVLENFPKLSKWEECFSYLGLAKSFLPLGQSKESIQYGLKGYEIAASLNANWDLQQLTKVLAASYELEENYHEAYRYYKEYKALSDTLFNKESEMRINFLLLEQKDLENIQLEQENRLKEEELTIKNQQIAIFIIAIVAFILLVVLQFRNSKRLSRLNNELKMLNQTKDKFFAIIAHDIKSPFNSLLGFLNILKNPKSNLSGTELHQFSELLFQSANNVYKLLENLLEWARLQTNNIEFKPSVFSLEEVVAENIALLNPVANNKQIQITSEVPKEQKVHADLYMVSTIIRNLISNAIKFTKREGEIHVSSQLKGDLLEVSIRDTGVGMDSEQISQLFNIAKKISTKGTEKELGTGLGLVLCKEFIEKNKGTLSVESELQKGSTFSFTLPVKG